MSWVFKVRSQPILQLSLAVLVSEDGCTGERAGMLMSRRACSCSRCGRLDYGEFPPLIRVANDGLAREFFLRFAFSALVDTDSLDTEADPAWRGRASHSSRSLS